MLLKLTLSICVRIQFSVSCNHSFNSSSAKLFLFSLYEVTYSFFFSRCKITRLLINHGKKINIHILFLCLLLMSW